MRLRPSIESAEALDSRLLQAGHLGTLQPDMFNWSRSVRSALGIAAIDLARRLGISQSAVTQLERSEANGTISIARLQALADALGCDLIYGFVPRQPLVDTARQIQRQQDKARKAKRKIPRP